MGPLSGDGTDSMDSMDKDVMAMSDDWTVDMEEHGDMVYVDPCRCRP
jgi:hypothetical protein